MRTYLLLLTAILVVSVAGCGSGLPETADVSGTITFNGKPLPGGTITFHPKGEGKPGFGVLESDGTYTLSTYENKDGAVLGEHVVTVEIFAGQGGSGLPGAGAKSGSIPKIYGSPDSSPLRFTVEKGDNTADFALKTNP